MDMNKENPQNPYVDPPQNQNHYGNGMPQAQYPNNGVPGNGYPGNGYPGNGLPPGAYEEGKKDATAAWIIGLIGLFIFGIILGPIALFKAYKAKALGASATAGFVLGWISTIGGLFSLILALTGTHPYL